MPTTLTKEQRSALEKLTLKAREAAETAARSALENLAVHEASYRAHMDEAARRLRNRLRARGRALGDRLDPIGTQSIDQLAEAAAYEHWHRLLFTRFLADNHLLHTGAEHGGVPVTLAECDELAPELGARDGFDLACRFASETLPGIFRRDDPVLDLRLAPNHEVQLRRLLDELPAETFRTDDALGWTYQFWQAKRKDEVNKSGVKIGARELPAVTQLFTEDYMVEFLLHNSLGAWWAAKERGRPARDCATELEARKAASLPPRDGLPGIDWTYLRFVQRSAAVPAANRGRDARAPFLDPFSAIDVTEHNLPHWQQGEAWVFVTWRLADSLPAHKLRQWEEEKDAWLARHPEPWDPDTTREFHERFTQRIEDWLDAGHGACILRQPEVREIVVGALAFFDGKRYELGDWVVMPNHVHVLFRPLGEHRLPDILHSWKSFTAKAIDKLLGRSGPVWQEDYWDRLVRNERHLDACQHYIADNPIKAQLPPGAYQRSPAVPAGNRGRDARAPLSPAAGTFDAWPRSAAEIRFLDPCMGSGHFLVFALPILARLRMEEEGLSAAEAVAAVLRDNLHGLEIDERCTQIAAFNVALTAWRLGGYQPLPELHLACSGLAPNAPEQTWISLAGPDQRLRRGMARLHALFREAPVLGSLIDPRGIEGDLIDADFGELQPLLARALEADQARDDEGRELGVVAQGLAKAAQILAGRYDLIATNVPYLARGKQSDTLKAFCERHYPDAKNDLANVFLERSAAVPAAIPGRDARAPVVQLVMPQNWLFLGSYRKQRERLLREVSWNLLGRLGPGAFETISGEVVNAILLTLTNTPADEAFQLSGIDASQPRNVADKAAALIEGEVVMVGQLGQLGNPDGRIAFGLNDSAKLLSIYANAYWGQGTGDFVRFGRLFWEIDDVSKDWEFGQTTVVNTEDFAGRHHVVFWQQGAGDLVALADALRLRLKNIHFRGAEAWGKQGIAVTLMNDLRVTRFTGQIFDGNCAAIIPKDPTHLPALWCYCSSPEFNQAVRRIDQKLNVTNATLVKVPFDLAHWQQVAAERYPEGLPKPYSDDPTQWLFDGHPWSAGVPPAIPGRDARAPNARAPLQVAVARLLGYRWPRQTGSEFPDCPALGPDGLEPFADADGIVCLPPINREPPAAVRLRALLGGSPGAPPGIRGRGAHAPLNEQALLAATGAKSKTLEDWLRDEFFEQHCKLFHNRPFVWHLWDGRKDGFHALVNYHRLDHANLQKLTYSYLGDWIRQQESDAKADKPGAAERLGAARALEQELTNILEGEPPYDIFIRWKPLKDQPLGWHPDLNDGVRLNIRPFMQARDLGKKGAGILRAKPNIKWDKDRGNEPQRDKADYPWFWHAEEPPLACPGGPDFTGNRWNNVHLTLARKRAARADGT